MRYTRHTAGAATFLRLRSRDPASAASCANSVASQVLGCSVGGFGIVEFSFWVVVIAVVMVVHTYVQTSTYKSGLKQACFLTSLRASIVVHGMECLRMLIYHGLDHSYDFGVILDHSNSLSQFTC